MRRIRILAIAMLLIGVSFIGTAYAYQSSYESSENSLAGQYVTLNYGVESLSILNYTQKYDTFVDGDNVTYSVPLAAGDIRQKLTSSPFEITIAENRETEGYRLVVTSDLPSLFATDEKDLDSWCQFVFVLTDDEDKVYYGLTELANGVAKSEYRFYKAVHDDEAPLAHESSESRFGAGTYGLDIYLMMNQESVTQKGVAGVPVDKTNFVDEFDTSDFSIRFTVLP